MKRSIWCCGVLSVLMLLVFPSCTKPRTRPGKEAAAAPSAPVKPSTTAGKTPKVEQAGKKAIPPHSPKKKNTMPTAAHAEDPKVKPEDQALIFAGRGVKRMRFQGYKKPLNVFIGGKISDLAGPLGIELGEGKSTAGTFSHGGHHFTYSDGKLTGMTLTLARIPGGVQDGNVVIPQRVLLASVKSLIIKCGKISKSGGDSSLACHGNKLRFTYNAKNGVRVQKRRARSPGQKISALAA